MQAIDKNPQQKRTKTKIASLPQGFLIPKRIPKTGTRNTKQETRPLTVFGQGHSGVVQLLLDNKADPGHTFDEVQGWKGELRWILVST